MKKGLPAKNVTCDTKGMTTYSGPVFIPGWSHLSSGKVRDIYMPSDATSRYGADVLLIVASDRISAFDYVLETVIPDKGKILTELSLWWFEQLEELCDSHLISTDVPEQVKGRAMIVRRLTMHPIECVVRGYITGSGLAEYNASGTVCGIELPPGLREADRLEEPIFTPAAKATMGEHDENISYSEVVRRVGDPVARKLRTRSIELYKRARKIAAKRGVIVADTKFEFGRGLEAGAPDVILGDEVLTPDSSRFWLAADYEPGRRQESLDKQLVRNWLLSPASGWSPKSGENPPPLPDDIVEQTRDRYLHVFELLTGRPWNG